LCFSVNVVDGSAALRGGASGLFLLTLLSTSVADLGLRGPSVDGGDGALFVDGVVNELGAWA
jgi:hypothetical protein